MRPLRQFKLDSGENAIDQTRCRLTDGVNRPTNGYFQPTSDYAIM